MRLSLRVRVRVRRVHKAIKSRENKRGSVMSATNVSAVSE